MYKLLIFICIVVSVNANYKDPRLMGAYFSSDIKEYPFMVSLQKEGRHMCGGTLITVNRVLTSAHCVFLKTQTTAVMGVTDWRDHKNAVCQKHEILRYDVHKNFTDYFSKYDIAICETDGNFDVNVHPNVQLVTLDLDTYIKPPRSLCMVVGWGATDRKGVVSDTLNRMRQEIIEYEHCKDYIKHSEELAICASRTLSGFEGPLMGDSGGPLLCDGKQVGIVMEGSSNPYELYTRLSFYKRWLQLRLPAPPAPLFSGSEFCLQRQSFRSMGKFAILMILQNFFLIE